MAQQLDIPDDMLAPGDLVDAYYQIRPGTSQYLVDAAIGDIKQALASDRRFHYQGSRIETLLEEDDGQVYEYLIVTLQVADPSKVTGSNPVVYDPALEQVTGGRLGAPQRAGLVGIIVLAALLAAAVVAASGSVIYKYWTLNRILDSDLSDETKRTAFQGQKASGFAAFGGSLVMAVIIIGVLWALSLSSRAHGGE